MNNNLRESHIRAFMKLSPAERLQWSLSSAWSTFKALPADKQKIYLKMRNNERRRRQL